MVLERVHTYTATTTPDRLVERLARRPMTYLGGPPGSGRFTAALVGLARHILELVRTAEPEPSELAQLSMLAREADAAVVFVGMPDHHLVDYRVDHARPYPRDVFLVWLERKLGDRGQCIDACPACEGNCVRSYVERCRSQYTQHLSVNTMADAVRFAADFAELQPDGTTAVDLLADRAALRAKAVHLLAAAPASDNEGRDGPRTRGLAQHRRAARLAFAVFDGFP
jgi:hypothetical protein